MNELFRIADRLALGTDLTSAAVLVALNAYEFVACLPEDEHALEDLRRLGCLKDRDLTPLGARVAVTLQALKWVEPFRGLDV